MAAPDDHEHGLAHCDGLAAGNSIIGDVARQIPATCRLNLSQAALT
jgi:hypothetical protein